MAFDKNLDKEIFSESVTFNNTKITVSVYSYNEGAPKLQISRENMNANSGEFSFTKLGRMTKEEVSAILPIIQKAMKYL